MVHPKVRVWADVQGAAFLTALFFIGTAIVRVVAWDWPAVQVRVTVALTCLAVVVWARRQMYRAQERVDRCE